MPVGDFHATATVEGSPLAIPFPFPNHMQDGFSMTLGDDLQLEYPSRDRVADPAFRTSYRPNSYVPTCLFKGPPTGHVIAT
jgi:hypothetical protein